MSRISLISPLSQYVPLLSLQLSASLPLSRIYAYVCGPLLMHWPLNCREQRLFYRNLPLCLMYPLCQQLSICSVLQSGFNSRVHCFLFSIILDICSMNTFKNLTSHSNRAESSWKWSSAISTVVIGKLVAMVTVLMLSMRDASLHVWYRQIH